MHRHSKARLLALTGAVSALTLLGAPAFGQSGVRERVRDSVAAAEAELSEAEKLRDRADNFRTAALLIDNVGETAGAVWDGAQAPFKIAANTANWSAAKQQEMGLLLAAKAIDRFNDVPTDQLTTTMIRAVITSSPDLAPLTNSVGIEKIRETLLLYRNDISSFQAQVTRAQAIHDNLLAAARRDLQAIREGQAVTEVHLRDQDAAIALLTVTVSDNADKLTEVTGKILASQSRLVTLQQQSQAETRSGVAAILRQGAGVEAAVNRTYSLAQAQMSLLEENKSLLDGLDVRTKSIQGGVNFLQAQQFREMAPADQLMILRDPTHPAYDAMFGGIPHERREKTVELYVEQAEAAVLKQEVISTVGTTMGVLNGIQELGITLGWEFTERKDFQNGMKALNLAAGLGMAYMTGNPVMALGSLNAAFASPNTAPSPGEAQILAMLGMMDKKLDDLLEGQTKILGEIEKSRAQAAEMHQQSMYRFDLVDQQFADLKQISAATVRAIVSLSPFNSQRTRCDFIRANFQDDTSLAALRGNVAAAPIHFYDCAALVESVWTRPQGSGAAPHFFLEMASETYVDPDGALSSRLLSFNEEQFSPLVRLLWQAYGLTWSPAGQPSSPVAYQLIASLADPAADIDSLRSKGLRFSERATDMLRWASAVGNQNRLGGLFANLLHPDHLIESLANLEVIAPYSDIRDLRQLSYAVYPADELGQNGQALDINSQTLEGQFNTALATLNLAIAQQSLLSGDYLIPNIADLIFSGQVSGLRNELIVALSKNPVLARNVLVYWIDNQLSKNRLLPERVGADGVLWPRSQTVDGQVENWAYNLEYYDGLLAGGVPSSADPCRSTQLSWKCLLPAATVSMPGKIALNTTRREPDGRITTLATYQLALPSAYELENRQIVLQDDLARLITARKNLYQLAEKMNIRKQLPALENIWVLPNAALRN